MEGDADALVRRSVSEFLSDEFVVVKVVLWNAAIVVVFFFPRFWVGYILPLFLLPGFGATAIFPDDDILSAGGTEVVIGGHD